MESNHHSRRHQGYSLGSSPVLSVRVRGVADRTRTDTAGLTTPGARRYTTATMDGDDRNRTGDRSPDKRVLLPSELRPQSCAAGIRTQDLELMRLARTAPPLPR
jgi:hypothetical protein